MAGRGINPHEEIQNLRNQIHQYEQLAQVEQWGSNQQSQIGAAVNSAGPHNYASNEVSLKAVHDKSEQLYHHNNRRTFRAVFSESATLEDWDRTDLKFSNHKAVTSAVIVRTEHGLKKDGQKRRGDVSKTVILEARVMQYFNGTGHSCILSCDPIPGNLYSGKGNLTRRGFFAILPSNSAVMVGGEKGRVVAVPHANVTKPAINIYGGETIQSLRAAMLDMGDSYAVPENHPVMDVLRANEGLLCEGETDFVDYASPSPPPYVNNERHCLDNHRYKGFYFIAKDTVNPILSLIDEEILRHVPISNLSDLRLRVLPVGTDHMSDIEDINGVGISDINIERMKRIKRNITVEMEFVVVTLP